MRPIRIALAQMDCVTGEVSQNLDRIRALVQAAVRQQADLVCLSELCVTGYNMFAIGRRYFDLAQAEDSEVCRELATLAAEARVHLIVGLPLQGRLPGIVYNGGIVLSPQGVVVGRFAKIHPWSLEQLYFTPGDWYGVFDTTVGRIGCMICYDVAFPEVARILTLRGAQVIVCPSAWRIEDDYIWFLSARARALENGVYVVAVNQVGIEPDTFGRETHTHLFGHSLVVDPRGEIVGEGDDGEGVTVITVDLDQVHRQRSEATFLKDRRPEAYGDLSRPLPAPDVSGPP
ncbi:MAG: nitrilase-related carbon-nitrogen hydrolase [Armatimonadota bacterium]|nr:nitrilase-related carbon-nitrogen hydrolase [Armatimonadota bacterium]MDR7486353.1 nitrilase-related carbon-nitrogen hydrolase [Armatimonadota bacterium]MDR7534230.1 nitrilase-related carbon-nitrogen hydrolase [Armatimonadota bacterium]MDR7536754.1 nitrilase-related carbon-nitrogen hydrolase [Armatimonadota bacterium]